MQDNALVYTSHVVQKWLGDFSKENQIELLDWPAYSSNLNPIENIWKLLKDAINVRGVGREGNDEGGQRYLIV